MRNKHGYFLQRAEISTAHLLSILFLSFYVHSFITHFNKIAAAILSPVSIQDLVSMAAVRLQVRPSAHTPQLQRFVTATGQQVVAISWPSRETRDGQKSIRTFHGWLTHSVCCTQRETFLFLTVEADSPHSSLLTVYGPEQMLRKLRKLRSGLRERHDPLTCVEKHKHVNHTNNFPSTNIQCGVLL